MKFGIRLVGMMAATAGVVAGSAYAVPIGMDAFSPGATLVDFELIDANVACVDQYAAQGVTFEPGLFGDPFPASTITGTRELTNYGTPVVITPVTSAVFSTPQRRVGALLGGFVGQTTNLQLTVYRQGLLLEQLTISTTGPVTPGGNIWAAFLGIEREEGIDRVEFTNLLTDNRALQIDDLRFEVVPAPGVGAALLGAFVLPRRRRR